MYIIELIQDLLTANFFHKVIWLKFWTNVSHKTFPICHHLDLTLLSVICLIQNRGQMVSGLQFVFLIKILFLLFSNRHDVLRPKNGQILTINSQTKYWILFQCRSCFNTNAMISYSEFWYYVQSESVIFYEK